MPSFRLTLLVALFLMCLTPAALLADPLQAGAATSNLTPPIGDAIRQAVREVLPSFRFDCEAPLGEFL